MIDVVIKMKVPDYKRNEILQTIKDLLVKIRREQGCVNCHCYLNVEEADVVILEQEWNTNEALATHLKFDHFKILLGMTKLLSIEPDIRINTVLATEGLEAIVTGQ